MTPSGTVIVGGGLAGLAAATALAERGIAVTLLEARAKLGGRASSFVDPETGETIDNCQHVSLGCCTNLAHFCRTVGVSEFFRIEKQLTFVGPAGEFCVLSEARLPAPFHLLPSLLSLSYLTGRERRLLISALRQLAALRPGDAETSGSFEDWLAAHGQTPALREKFWHVVLVSALSETLDRIDVGHARKVFVDTFLADRRGWRVEVPRVPLDQLYGKPIEEWLRERGVAVRLSAAARQIEVSAEGVRAVVLRDGECVGGSDFILAAPQYRIPALLPEELRRLPVIAALEQIETAPISSVHLWFDRPIMSLPHAVLVGRVSQWVFNRSKIFAGDAQDGSHCYQVVISASHEVRERPQSEMIQTVVNELASIWPDAGRASLLRARVVTEQRAVFSPTPGIDRLRPPQQTSVPNLQLAGDWTRTGWPATMEGAVRSGYLAAENVLARRGHSESLLQPDLPVSGLSRLLLGVRSEPLEHRPASAS